MRLLTPEENRFLDVFLHEATTAPFSGPATKALHELGVDYGNISYLRGLIGTSSLRPVSLWATLLTSCRDPLGRTDSPRCGETRRSCEFGSNDNKTARARSARMNRRQTCSPSVSVRAFRG